MTTADSKLIEGRTGAWEIVLGLEVHAQVASKSKLFSGAAVGFGAGPNEQVSLVDAAMPGMLPVINRHCVEQAVRSGLGLKAKINTWSRFDRKNYFYPDLPQGYQISQYKDPIVGEGEIEVEHDDGSSFRVRIERLHLEQDAGKSIHDLDPNATYVDLNRSGVALMEIVSFPDMRSSDEAAAYVKKLRTILRYLGTCDGDMEKGNLRADVNVSVRRPGGPLGTRTETKNVNSFRFIQLAIEFEARRQIEILEDGGAIDQETRLFDPSTGGTRSMRSKEDAQDYRYFPDPDLLPLELDPAWIKEIEASLPELPDDKRRRLMSQYGLSAYDAGVLSSEKEKADFFEASVRDSRTAKFVANTVTQELSTIVNASNLQWNATGIPTKKLISSLPSPDLVLDTSDGKIFFEVKTHHNDPSLVISPNMIQELAVLVTNQTISSKIARDIVVRMADGEGSPNSIVEGQGLVQLSDSDVLSEMIDQLIAANPGQAEAVKAKPQAIGWFVGQVMRQTQGKANPGAVNEILKAKLGVS